MENSSAYAGLLAKILPHQIAADADSHGGRTEIIFRRIIVSPEPKVIEARKEIEGVTPKALPEPDSSHVLPRPTTDDTNEGAV